MRIAVVLLLFIVVAAPGAAQPSQPPSGAAAVSLADLERMALETNPTLRAAQAQIDAARGRARQAATWPNPVAGYTGEELRAGDRDRRGTHGFFVEQTIVLGGKLRLGRAVFERAAEQADQEHELQRQRILSSVRRAFYEVLALDRRVEVHERLAALASETVGVTAQQFNVGAADRPDFLASEIEARRVQLELTAARNRAAALRQQLAAVVGVAEVAGRTLSGSIDAALPALEREAAVRAVIEQSPQMRAARAALARMQATTALARRETVPDLFVRGGAGHNRERGEDTGRPLGWEGTIEAGITIPLFNRNAGGITAARADEAGAQAEIQRLEQSLRARAADAFATYLTAVGESEAYRRDILPRAEEAYRLYLARYREIGAAYPQVLAAQRSLFELSSRYLERLDEAWKSAVRIQCLLAGDGLQAPGDER